MLERVSKIIAEYKLISDEPVAIAYSGGKDSLFLLLTLRELGFKIKPVIIDVGYENGFINRLVEYSKKYHLEIDIISIKDLTNVFMKEVYSDVIDRFKYIQKLKKESGGDFTPCTQCYNIKMIVLYEYCLKNQIKKIAFGHHGSDSISSMLKSVFYYMDRWDKENHSFKKDNFNSIVEENLHYFFNGLNYFRISDFYKKIISLSSNLFIGTDEAPLQKKHYNYIELDLIRPLFYIYENEIEAYKKTNKLITEDSGCAHTSNIKTQTSREIVHFKIVKKIFDLDQGHDMLNELLKIVLLGINDLGELKYDFRNNRNLILGENYKTGFKNNIKL